jgi:hypothetical protein
VDYIAPNSFSGSYSNLKSATFENPNGWYLYSSGFPAFGIQETKEAIPSTTMADPTLAANLIKENAGRHITRNLNKV